MIKFGNLGKTSFETITVNIGRMANETERTSIEIFNEMFISICAFKYGTMINKLRKKIRQKVKLVNNKAVSFSFLEQGI